MQNLPSVVIFKICSYIPEHYCPILRLVNHKFYMLIQKTKVSLTKVMRIASFQLVNFLHSFTDYKSPHYLLNLCHQPYSENKMKCLDYLVPLTNDKLSFCYLHALSANDIKTLEYLGAHKFPKPDIMVMHQWNHDIYKLLKLAWGINLKFICVCPVDYPEYAEQEDEKIFLKLKKLAMTQNYLEFNILYSKTQLTAQMRDNLISQITSLEILKHIVKDQPEVYLWLYKKTRDTQLLDQLKFYSDSVLTDHWRLLSYDLKLCQWLCQNDISRQKIDWSNLSCSPENVNTLVNRGLKLQPTFFGELNSVQPQIWGESELEWICLHYFALL